MYINSISPWKLINIKYIVHDTISYVYIKISKYSVLNIYSQAMSSLASFRQIFNNAAHKFPRIVFHEMEYTFFSSDSDQKRTPNNRIEFQISRRFYSRRTHYTIYYGVNVWFFRQNTRTFLTYIRERKQWWYTSKLFTVTISSEGTLAREKVEDFGDERSEIQKKERIKNCELSQW